MENFILWSITPGKEKTDLSFFASWVQAQRIQNGTKEMVKEMLDDLGIKEPEIKKWSLSHFATDYLTDDPDDPEWPNVWAHTAEIEVSLGKPARVKKDDTALVRTYARDTTWKGDEKPPMPLRCVVVADFPTKKDAQQAAKLLTDLGSKLEDGSEFQVQGSQERVQKLVDQLREEYASLSKKKKSKPVLAVTERGSDGKQLAIALGEFDAAFYKNGAELAQTVEEICRVFNGAPTWEESTEPES